MTSIQGLKPNTSKTAFFLNRYRNKFLNVNFYQTFIIAAILVAIGVFTLDYEALILVKMFKFVQFFPFWSTG